MKYILLILLLLLSVGVVSADFNTELVAIGLPQKAVDHVFGGVTTYSYSNIPNDVIVQISHVAPYGTIVEEHYIISNIDIHVLYSCMNAWFTTTCDFQVDGGGMVSSNSISYADWGYSVPVTDTTIVWDSTHKLGSPGDIWFGVGKQGFADNGFVDTRSAIINLSVLTTSMIVSMSGVSSAPIDVTIQTLSVAEYSDFLNAAMMFEFNSIIVQIQAFITGIMIFCIMIIEHPILIFAYVEIFAFLYALKARDMEEWWMKYIKVHGDILQFIFSNAQAIIIALVIVSILAIIGEIVGV